MNDSTAPVEIAFRIPGQWTGPQDLIARLPEGYSVTPEALILPDGSQVEFGAMEADDQFAQIFHSSCRNPATDDERAIVDAYTVNVVLSGPGGSLDAARKMMDAAAAIIRAGGAGVFIDNSGVAHGGQDWLSMNDDGGPDALSFAFVAIIGSRNEAYTMGMHTLGLRDIVMTRADAEVDDFGIVEVIRYSAESEKPIDDGHVLADLSGPRYQATVIGDGAAQPGSPQHNPFGRIKLVSMHDIAENN